ncbi:MAG: ABC transporter ATP-binding protein [Gemmatimonadota bacterium]|jgi:ABC-2 type transport system ATP-binding protein|nr:ABC transporter ATP-binding protein [Gemmatimonadota bacterium]MDP7032323.1 ABC transporter ATP-binding protein [Gemmatimonadota bacterium]
MIHAEMLTRRFGDITAVDGASLDARPGEVTGLLGPNGAGKTTTLSMISGLLAPTSGRILLDGIDLAAEPRRAKSLLGVVPQEIALYEELSARENLEFWGALRGLSGTSLRERIEEVLALVELSDRRDPVSRFSGGMKRRLNLAAGVVHRPRILLLDEPTVGIDVHARARILELVRQMARDGTTVLYTTHYLEEAEALCDRVAILDHGRILADGTLSQLQRSLGDGKVISARGSFTEEEFRARCPVGDAIHFPEDGHVLVAAGHSSAPGVLSALLDSGLSLDDVTIREPSLQSVFLRLTGRELRD